MYRLLSRLWNDDRGSVISVELILLLAILIFGIIPGIVALRNSLIASLGTVGNTLTSLIPSFTFSGFAIGPNNINNSTGGLPIALVNGYSLYGTTPMYLTGLQVAPYVATYVVIPPAP